MIFKKRYTLFLLILFSIFPFLSVGADKLPTAEDINLVITEADEIINGFWQDSFELRMRYEFADKFITEQDRLELLKLSEKATKILNAIIQKQQKLNKTIDGYEGSDWEERYGRTQLWRRLDHSYNKALSNKRRIDSYRTLSTKPAKIQTPIEEPQKSYSQSYEEPLIQLIISQRKSDFDSYIETINRHPDIKPFFCQLISYSFVNDPNFEIDIKEAEMLADHALQNGLNKNKELLVELQKNNDSNSPLIDYAAAMSLLETDKRRAVKLLVKASRSHNKNPHPNLKINAVEIAEQAAVLGYELYLEDPNYVETPAWSFYNYRELASDNIDEEIQWLFAHMHIDDCTATIGYDILRDIKNRGSKYSKKAALYLTSRQVRMDAYKELKQRQILLRQFADLLVDNNDCIFYREAYGLIENTLLQVELFSEDKNIILNCHRIAEFLVQCNIHSQANLLLAEAILITPEYKQLEDAQKVVNQINKEDQNLQFIRCKARLLYEKEKFAQAALLWGQIVSVLDKGDNENKWRWWRAKYYQLYCACKAGENRENITHAIDVLITTHTEMPAPWAEKLEELQQKLDQSN